MCYHRCILLTVESTLILLIYYFCSLVPQPLALKGLRHYQPTFTWLSKVMLMSSSFLMYFQVSSHTEICCEQFYVGTIFLGPTWNCTQYDLWIILSNQVMIFGKRHCCWVFQMYFFVLRATQASLTLMLTWEPLTCRDTTWNLTVRMLIFKIEKSFRHEILVY